MFDMNNVSKKLSGLDEQRIVIYPYGTNGKLINTMIEDILDIKYQEKILVDNNPKLSAGSNLQIISIDDYLSDARDEDLIIFTAENVVTHEELLQLIKNRRHIDILNEVKDERRYMYQHVAAQEWFDYYDATTALLTEYMSHKDMKSVNLLSVGGKVSELVPVMYLCNSVIHNTMIPTVDVDEVQNVIPYKGYTELVKDFFTLTKEEVGEANVIFSTVAIHCMNDTRYLNKPEEFKSYKFAQKVAEICPKMEAVVLSVPVNKAECISDNSSYLSNTKVIQSFEKAGFTLAKSLYDKCTFNDAYEKNNRFSMSFPEQFCLEHRYVIGNYIFTK